VAGQINDVIAGAAYGNRFNIKTVA